MSGTELKDLLDRLVEPVGQMPDVVPEVVAAGRRGVRRRRVAGSVLGVAAGMTVVASAILVKGALGGDGGMPGPAAQPTPSAVTEHDKPRTVPTTPDGTACYTGEEGNVMANGKPVPAALRQFHSRSASVLDAVLPGRVTAVRAMPQVQSYCVTAKGLDRALTLRVDAVAKAEEGRCDAETAGTCHERRLPGGHWAVAYDDGHARTVLGTTHVVTVDTFNSGAASAGQILDALADPRFTTMVEEWASHADWTGWGGDGKVTK